MAQLGNDNQSNIIFITTFDGKLVQRVEEGTEGATSRALTKGKNEGKIIWEKHYSNVTGMITSGEVAVKEFDGKKIREIQIKLDDNILLQLPMNMLSMFAKPLPNVDVTREVKISVYKNKVGRCGLQISQMDESGCNEEPCGWAYTRDEPNGLPSASQDDLGNWDFRDHDTFLIKKVQEFFDGIPKDNIENAPQATKEEPPKAADVESPEAAADEEIPGLEAPAEMEDEDDVPFN